MIQWLRNRIACHVVNVLYCKLPFKWEDEDKIRLQIIGNLAHKSKPPFYIYWNEKEGIFYPGIERRSR